MSAKKIRIKWNERLKKRVHANKIDCVVEVKVKIPKGQTVGIGEIKIPANAIEYGLDILAYPKEKIKAIKMRSDPAIELELAEPAAQDLEIPISMGFSRYNYTELAFTAFLRSMIYIMFIPVISVINEVFPFSGSGYLITQSILVIGAILEMEVFVRRIRFMLAIRRLHPQPYKDNFGSNNPAVSSVSYNQMQ